MTSPRPDGGDSERPPEATPAPADHPAEASAITPNDQPIRLRPLTADLGPEWSEVRADDPEEALIDFACSRQITTSFSDCHRRPPHRRSGVVLEPSEAGEEAHES